MSQERSKLETARGSADRVRRYHNALLQQELRRLAGPARAPDHDRWGGARAADDGQLSGSVRAEKQLF
jgi:hypothetical protein